jgi:transcriptional regulator with XRE-family HTH domain
MRLSARQISAAMALAGLTQDEVASLAGIGRPSLNRILNDEVVAKEETLRKIKQTLEAKGVEFIGNIGVQWAQHQVRTLAGVDGLKTFFDDVRHIVQTTDEEIVICGVAEGYLEDKLGEYLDYHRKEMTRYSNVKMRCLIEESDFDLGASDYCLYRWQPKENFSNVPFYIYGDKMAIIVTTAPEDPLVLLIQNRTISSAYRRQFEAMWDSAKEPVVK